MAGDFIPLPRWLLPYLQPNAAAIKALPAARFQAVRAELATKLNVPVEDLDKMRGRK